MYDCQPLGRDRSWYWQVSSASTDHLARLREWDSVVKSGPRVKASLQDEVLGWLCTSGVWTASGYKKIIIICTGSYETLRWATAELTNEPPHDKSNIHVHPAKTRISLGIPPVWSESSLSAWRKLGSLATHWEHSENSDQIRLGECPGWSESSLSAQSFCWFCHEATQIYMPTAKPRISRHNCTV